MTCLCKQRSKEKREIRRLKRNEVKPPTPDHVMPLQDSLSVFAAIHTLQARESLVFPT